MVEPTRAPGDEIPRWLPEVLLATAVTLAIALIVTLGRDAVASPFAYLFAVGFGALTLLRHRWPLLMLAATVLGIVVYHALDHPPIGVAVPLAAALYAAAEAGRAGWAIGAGMLVFAISMGHRLGEGESTAYLVGYEGVSNAALIVAATALGSAVRSRRVSAAQQARIGRLTEEQSARRTERLIRGERERLSRDLHDTVGHAMSVISLQASVAAEAVGRDDGAARAAIEHVVNTSNRSLLDMRSMVRLLRDDTPAPGADADAPVVLSLVGVPDLVATARRVGLEATCHLDVPPDRLPPRVEATAYRVVQEALTNVVRHAGATEARVCAELGDGVLHLTISDNGTTTGSWTAPERGHGLAGMRERVRLLGGTLTAGPRADGGFLVDTRLPIEAA